MNYLIVSQMRSGSSYLGELLGVHPDLEYYNELFTSELCRRSDIMPQELDDDISRFVLHTVFSRNGAGFKIIYGQSTSETWARLVLNRDLYIIHILRENLMEQLASIFYLERQGLSMAMATKRGVICLGTDGQEVKPNLNAKYEITVRECRQFFNDTEFHRMAIWSMFHKSHPYMEVHFENVFQEACQKDILKFLDRHYRFECRPNHIKTPRPPARELISNYVELREIFMGTKWAWFFQD